MSILRGRGIFALLAKGWSGIAIAGDNKGQLYFFLYLLPAGQYGLAYIIFADGSRYIRHRRRAGVMASHSLANTFINSRHDPPSIKLNNSFHLGYARLEQSFIHDKKNNTFFWDEVNIFLWPLMHYRTWMNVYLSVDSVCTFWMKLLVR